MGRRLLKPVLVATLVLGLAVVSALVANAFWRGSGSGTGSGATGTTVALTLSPATPTDALYPGGQASVVLTVRNSNTSAVRIGSLALDTSQGTGGFSVDGGHSGCAVATLSFATQTNGGAGWTVPARVGGVDGELPTTLTNALSMGVGAANACQGASSTVYLAAGP
jgi:hypothetical protein